MFAFVQGIVAGVPPRLPGDLGHSLALWLSATHMRLQISVKEAPSIPSAELSRSLKDSDRGRNAPKPIRNRSESVSAGLWEPPREFLAWSCPDRGPMRVPNRRFPAGFSKVSRALFRTPVFGLSKQISLGRLDRAGNRPKSGSTQKMTTNP